jgi:hypothetical protein
MDHETTAGEFQVPDQATADEIRQHVEESLDAAEGDVSPLTGVETADGHADAGDGAGQVRKKLEEVRVQVQDKVADVAGAAQARATEATAAVSGAAEDLLGQAKAADPASAATQAWQFVARNPAPVAVGGAFVAGLLLGRRGRA